MRPLADLAGWPLQRLRRLTGRLARENSKRNPSRTAVTAAALMIALALVTFITVFASGLKSSVAQVIEENFAGGLVIENSDGFSPIPAGAAFAAAKVPGVKSVATIRGPPKRRCVGAGRHGEGERADARTSKKGSKSNGCRAGRRNCATCVTTKRSSPTTSPTNTTSRSATPSPC